MNNEGYEKYVIRKCSVAVAIAVIKTKPQDLTLMEYLNQLRVKLDSHLDIFQDICISENDFVNSDDEEINYSNKDFENRTNRWNFLEKDHINCNSNTVFNTLQSPEGKNGSSAKSDRMDLISEVGNVCGADVNDSISILTGFNIDKANLTEEEAQNGSIKEILDIFKEIDTSRGNEALITTSTPKHHTQSTLCETPQINLTDNHNVKSKVAFSVLPHNSKNANNKIDVLPNNTRDSQETELYTLYGYTNYFSCISQSQDNISVPTNLLHNRVNTTHHNNESSKNNKLENVHNEVIKTVDKSIDSNINSKYEHNVNKIQISDNTVLKDNINIEKLHTAISLNASTKNLDIVGNKTHKSANSQASSDEYSFLFTDVTKNVRNRKPSQEESENIYKSFSGSCDKTTFTSMSFLRDTDVSSNCCRSDSLNKYVQNHQGNTLIYHAGTESCSAKENRSFNLSDNQFLFFDSMEGVTSKNDECNAIHKSAIAANGETIERFNIDKYYCKCAQFESGYVTQCTSKNDRQFDEHNEMENKSDTTERLEEMVTFKIFEELNRIKNYIGRSDRRLSDSGRSNSQGSQLSGVRINESGYCLMSYIMEYPLVLKTMDITEEVSQVLGKFIDKLHEDENCPPFLEKILENVQELLTDIYEASRHEDLLKKEEQMNRVLLLNRSKNVIMYTIEKMLPILDDVLSRLPKTDLMEITSLDKCENLCFIFHMLEILLKRHNATTNSQSITHISQDDDKSLKRSTITEIWRKKWNLTKSDVGEGSFKKNCALTQLSEVLNKIIVKGMDGYSLISFAALQCFNLLQSK